LAAVAEKISQPKIRWKKFGQPNICLQEKFLSRPNFLRQFRRQVCLWIFSTAYSGFHQHHEFMTLKTA
jgi:hypothetical protein